MLAVKFQEVSVKASLFSLIEQNVIGFNTANLCTQFYTSHIFGIMRLFFIFSFKNIYVSLFTLFSLILYCFYLIHHYIDSYNSFSFLSRFALRYLFLSSFLCFFLSLLSILCFFLYHLHIHFLFFFLYVSFVNFSFLNFFIDYPSILIFFTFFYLSLVH